MVGTAGYIEKSVGENSKGLPIGGAIGKSKGREGLMHGDRLCEGLWNVKESE